MCVCVCVCVCVGVVRCGVSAFVCVGGHGVVRAYECVCVCVCYLAGCGPLDPVGLSLPLRLVRCLHLGVWVWAWAWAWASLGRGVMGGLVWF